MTEPLNETLDVPIGVVDPYEIKRAEGFIVSPEEGTALDMTSLGQGGFGSVDEHSGGYSYGVNVFVPPSRSNAPAPYLSLTYSSFNSNRETPSLIGIGWKLELGRIERTGKFGQTVNFLNNQGQETAVDHFVLILSGRSYTLVKLRDSEHRFYIKNEQFFAEAIRVLSNKPDPDSGDMEIDHWELYLGNGMRYRYGVVGGAGETPVAGQLRNKVWHLMEVENSFGYKVVYEYGMDDIEPNPSRPELPYSYPEQVKLGVNQDNSYHEAEVVFHYAEESPPGGDNGYYRLGIDHTGRRSNPFTEVRSIIRRRLAMIETRFRNLDGELETCRQLEVRASEFEQKFRVDAIQELCIEGGKEDKTCAIPPYEFTYIAQPPDHPALMETATSPMGTVSKVEYALATDPDIEHGIPDVDDVLYLVKTRTEIAEAESWSTRYDYWDVKQYLPFAKEFRGHSQVQTTDLTTGARTVTRYDQTGVWNGQVIEKHVYDNAGKLIQHVESKLRALKFGGGRFFPFAEEGIERSYAEDGETLLSTKVKVIPRDDISLKQFPWGYPIDQYGNFWRTDTFTYEGDRAADKLFFSQRIEQEFENRIDPDKPRFIGLRLCSKTHAKSAKDTEWQLLNWEESRFDSNGLEIQADLYYDSIDKNKIYRKSKEYDPDTGLLLRRWKHKGKSDEKRLLEEMRYYESGPFKHLPKEVANAKGQITRTLDYDLRFVLPTEVLDRNGLVARTSYDSYGRKLEELFGPHESTFTSRGDKENLRYEYIVSRTERSHKTVNVHTGTASKIYYDTLSREIRTEGTGYQGQMVIETIEYDHKTRKPWRQSLPFFEGNQALGFTETQYEPARNRIHEITAPNGGVTRYDYDGLTTRVFEDIYDLDDDGEKGEFLFTELVRDSTVDVLGQTIREAEGHNETGTRFEVYKTYDTDQRLVEVRDVAGTVLQTADFGTRIDDNAAASFDISLGNSTFNYDEFGRLETVHSDFRAELDRVTQFVYDELDRVIRTEVQDTLGESKRTVDTCFDQASFGIGAIASQSVTESASRGTFLHSEQFFYDEFGNSAGKKVSWEVDWPELGIHKQLSCELGFEHDGDRGGRLQKITFPDLPGVDRKIAEYAYDDFSGYLQSVHYDGMAVWQTGARGYDENGAVLETIAANGTGTSYEYNAKDGGVKRATTERFGETLFEQLLRTDSIGNIRQRKTRVNIPSASGGETVNLSGEYRYDDKHQLTGVSEGDFKQSFTYRADGSRLSVAQNGEKTDYHYENPSPHQLSRLSGARIHDFVYDKAGNLVSEINQDGGAARQLDWSAGNRLARALVTDADENTKRHIQYAASAGGRRAFMFDETKNRAVFYEDLHFDVEWDTQTDELTLNNHISNSARRVATSILSNNDTTKLYFPHRDQVQSVSAITDHNGEVIAIFLYESFGRVMRQEGDFQPDRLFTNQRAEMLNDEGFALYDYVARWYDPNIGAFVSPDPNEDSGNIAFGYNRYVYVGNNPLSATDPSGMEKHKAVAIILPGAVDSMENSKEFKPLNNYIDQVAEEVHKIKDQKTQWTKQALVGYLSQGEHAIIFDHPETSFDRAGNRFVSTERTMSGAKYAKLGQYSAEAGNKSVTLMICRGEAGRLNFEDSAKAVAGKNAPKLYATSDVISFTDQNEFVSIEGYYKNDVFYETGDPQKVKLVGKDLKTKTNFKGGNFKGNIIGNIQMKGKMGKLKMLKKAGSKVLKGVGGPVMRALDVYSAVQDGTEMYNMAQRGDNWNLAIKAADVGLDYVPRVGQVKGVFQGVYGATRFIDEQTNSSLSKAYAESLKTSITANVAIKLWNWWDGCD